MAVSAHQGTRSHTKQGKVALAAADTAIRVVVARSLEALAEHAAAWDGVLHAVPHPAPQLSYAWVATLLEYEVGPGEAWWCCFAYDGERLVGVLPVVARLHRPLGRRWPRLRAADERGSLVRMADGSKVFRARLSPNFAGNLRKARNKLAKLPGASMEVNADPALADAAFDRFVAVEAAGWKGEGGSAIGCSAGRTAFFRALARRLAANGSLEWHF